MSIDTTICYFNDDYYDWDLCNIKAVNVTTGQLLDRSSKEICPICGGKKSAQAKECIKCSPIKKPHYEVSREELKELIYTLPFTKIGEKFGVTDNAIRKRCRAYGLPATKSEIKKYTKEDWDKI